MTTTPDQPAATGNGASAGNYGYPAEAADSSHHANRITRLLWAVVAVLGAATLGVGLSLSLATGFSVRLAVLAAVISAVGLLPRHMGRGRIVVAFAVTGLPYAVSTWVTGSGWDWALPVIVVLNASQSLAAVGALLSETGTVGRRRTVRRNIRRTRSSLLRTSITRCSTNGLRCFITGLGRPE
jgi:hypothetical protein